MHQVRKDHVALKTFTIAELSEKSQGELISHIHELMWELGICAACGGEIHHHMDEPFYTCQKCGVSGEATVIPRVQQVEMREIRKRMMPGAAMKSRMRKSTVSEMEDMIVRGCSTPGCTHDNHKELFLRQRCHPSAGLDVRYEKGTGVINVTCRQCKLPVLDIGVALA